jgi:hypothetical protein
MTKAVLAFATGVDSPTLHDQGWHEYNLVLKVGRKRMTTHSALGADVALASSADGSASLALFPTSCPVLSM